jgi:hypothetical protein
LVSAAETRLHRKGPLRRWRRRHPGEPGRPASERKGDATKSSPDPPVLGPSGSGGRAVFPGARVELARLGARLKSGPKNGHRTSDFCLPVCLSGDIYNGLAIEEIANGFYSESAIPSPAFNTTTDLSSNLSNLRHTLYPPTIIIHLKHGRQRFRQGAQGAAANSPHEQRGAVPYCMMAMNSPSIRLIS